MLTFLLLAQAVPDPDTNLEVFLKLILDSAAGGQWAMLGALLLVGGVFLARKTLAPKVPFLATPEGGSLLNLLGSFGSALVLALTGTPFSWALVWAVLLSVLSTGGRAFVKNLLWPMLLRIPALANLFGRGDAAEATAKAQKAGLAAAVVAKAPKADDVANGP
jgi:hypothetical protein